MGFYEAMRQVFRHQPRMSGREVTMDWIRHRLTHTYWLTNRVNFLAKLVSYYNFFGIFTDAHQPPFYYHGGPDAVNYGSIGSVLAEELLSAIDLMGTLFFIYVP